MTTPTTPQIVVSGANGQLGRLVVEALLARGVDPARVTLASRDPGKLADLAARGFRTARADYDDPSSLATAYAGAEVVLAIAPNGAPETRKTQGRAAFQAAKAAGVGRVVYTSFTNPTAASRFVFGSLQEAVEADLRGSGLAYTIVRDNQYFENLDGSLGNALATGALAMPGVNGKVAYVAREDIAAVLARVLTEGGHEGKTYELTGPEALSLHDVAAQLGAIAGKPIAVVDVAPAQFGEVLGSFGLPPFLVEALLGMYAASEAGEYAAVSGDVEALLGRPATSFKAWAAARYAAAPAGV